MLLFVTCLACFACLLELLTALFVTRYLVTAAASLIAHKLLRVVCLREHQLVVWTHTDCVWLWLSCAQLCVLPDWCVLCTGVLHVLLLCTVWAAKQYTTLCECMSGSACWSEGVTGLSVQGGHRLGPPLKVVSDDTGAGRGECMGCVWQTAMLRTQTSV